MTDSATPYELAFAELRSQKLDQLEIEAGPKTNVLPG